MGTLFESDAGIFSQIIGKDSKRVPLVEQKTLFGGRDKNK
jgi:hypothetical protein